MFDVGLVLAVAFLLAALKSAHLTDLLTKSDVTIVSKTAAGQTVIVKRGDQLRTLKLAGGSSAGPGTQVGAVYRLANGQLVYVTKKP
jgi:hypothetical protein